jgi:hypothetical protein
MNDELQEFWDNIFSEQPEKIINAYSLLNARLQQSVIIHLYNIINEPGWQPAKVVAAQFAIDTIEDK